MTPPSHPRRFASQLLRAALSIAPHGTLDWGQGMLSELNHVEGNWSALLWAFGGAGVLAKHAVLSAIFTGSNGPILPSAADLFEKESSMRKPILAAIGACVVASLLFFLAPVFRQAFHVSLAQWHHVFKVERGFGYRKPDPALDVLAKKAEQNHDAEALAFVAGRYPNRSDAARFADEAVHLDPNLTWIYAVVAVQWSSLPEIDRWVPALQKFDPQNALPYLITAERIDIDQVVREQVPHSADEQTPEWRAAMASAFQSRELDDYLDRFKDLDRRVLLRYRIDDPFQVGGEDWDWYGLPSYGVADSDSYAKLLIESGESLEARGDYKAAAEKYSSVARYSQMLGLVPSLFLRREIKQTYKHLEMLSERSGNKTDAAFYSALSEQIDLAAERQLASWRKASRGSRVSSWNAFLVKLSGMLMLLFSAVLLLCVFGVMIRGRSIKLPSLRPSSMTLALGFGSAVGVLLSSAVLFVSYWPYSELLQSFLRNGDESGIPELSNFLGIAQVPLGTGGFLGVSNAVFHFWFGVIVLCVVTLLFVLWRFRHRPRVAAAA
ncbi:MAG TPA: hypothetical protein VGI46_12620 [Candidatus Acidoferrum sp.]|jgi:hypothetical protein